ncbi:uncharacterized protein CMU_023400 [Cryptosporidium muris RN66]|uniref:Uncharacterized protein n=1 Tax=Cryptosporidium muris (strain RN66) TaxID=441375 RepID=B6ABY2_CRYMR|nr:uncharacterized protein CMU_023400 [Cryptosporidium muris RN66]EEA05335.1 hypothetical protein CMU_023400 [Cryptosporidium muris RN66]|eukprot:XP_002139684.1 hypothetical protein [Cryptosporidium muris RN66]
MKSSIIFVTLLFIYISLFEYAVARCFKRRRFVASNLNLNDTMVPITSRLIMATEKERSIARRYAKFMILVHLERLFLNSGSTESRKKMKKLEKELRMSHRECKKQNILPFCQDVVIAVLKPDNNPSETADIVVTNTIETIVEERVQVPSIKVVDKELISNTEEEVITEEMNIESPNNEKIYIQPSPIILAESSLTSKKLNSESIRISEVNLVNQDQPQTISPPFEGKEESEYTVHFLNSNEEYITTKDGIVLNRNTVEQVRDILNLLIKDKLLESGFVDLQVPRDVFEDVKSKVLRNFEANLIEKADIESHPSVQGKVKSIALMYFRQACEMI